MMQDLDTDIALTLDDREPELVYETSGWSRLVQGSILALIAPTIVALLAEFTDRDGLLNGALVAFGLLFVLAVFALVMEYRADHRAPEVGGHGA